MIFILFRKIWFAVQGIRRNVFKNLDVLDAKLRGYTKA